MNVPYVILVQLSQIANLPISMEHSLSAETKQCAVNPGHWTEDMRTDALEPALLNDRSYKVDSS